MRFINLTLICIVITGCGSSIGRGTTLYQQQSYIEAAEVFERTQSRLTMMDPVERARYGLYRGLTLMALGDLRGAERWLDYAEAQEHGQPGLLAREERAMLTHGRMDLGERRQAEWPKPEPHWAQGVAATTTASDSQ
jgi:tetratricopeptide (TPR) repeat protein